VQFCAALGSLAPLQPLLRLQTVRGAQRLSAALTLCTSLVHFAGARAQQLAEINHAHAPQAKWAPTQTADCAIRSALMLHKQASRAPPTSSPQSQPAAPFRISSADNLARSSSFNLPPSGRGPLLSGGQLLALRPSSVSPFASLSAPVSVSVSSAVPVSLRPVHALLSPAGEISNGQ